jgi:hypothetical protein
VKRPKPLPSEQREDPAIRAVRERREAGLCLLCPRRQGDYCQRCLDIMERMGKMFDDEERLP